MEERQFLGVTFNEFPNIASSPSFHVVRFRGADIRFHPDLRDIVYDSGVGGKSSFWIVPTPCFPVTMHPAQLDRLTLNVSSGSIAVSPYTTTVIVINVWPGANVSIPEFDT